MPTLIRPPVDTGHAPALTTIFTGPPFNPEFILKIITGYNPSPGQLRNIGLNVSDELKSRKLRDVFQGLPVTNATAGPSQAATGRPSSPRKGLDQPRGGLPDLNAADGPSNKVTESSAPKKKKRAAPHMKASEMPVSPRDGVHMSEMRLPCDDRYKAQAEEEERQHLREGQETADHEHRRDQRVLLKVWTENGKEAKLLEHFQYVHPHILLTGNLRQAADLNGPMPVAQWKKMGPDTWAWTTLIDDVPILEVEDGIRTFYLCRDDVTDIVDPPSGHSVPQPDRRQVQGPTVTSWASAQARRNLVNDRAFMRTTRSPRMTNPA
ncbi:hypothetical protein EWM64_g7385 [Hericium alpestre]|uniref:Uncharacterized protein n=1 Tax=Hericium alpestre TaxID=135208 RepID=A0A4Y9ZPW3_9AGAM|nr:hypothetical protein EWM64_g7385 [Hericium alpestre]